MRDSTTTDSDRWTATAGNCARLAHKQDFSSRRGTYQLVERGKTIAAVYYDNHPYNDPAQRPRQLVRLRTRLIEAGLQEVASGSYPPNGYEDAGYTFVLIVAASSDYDEVSLRECVQKSLEWLDA